MNDPENDDRWNWKLRVIFSADIVGSTAYKSSKFGEAGEPQWASTFMDFYDGFPVAVEKGYSKANEENSLPPCESHMRVWKFAGDEILFQVVLKDHKHLMRHVFAFKYAICKYAEMWSKKEPDLSLKATAWLAGFPVTNREISIDAEAGIDFIGPSIDLGFRLSKFSTPRKFVISADLALMLLDAVHACDVHWEAFHVFMHGKEVLKGVLSGAPYPIFWVDTRDGRPDLEESLMGSQRPFVPHQAREYLRAFLHKTPRVRRPFIVGDPDHERYGTVPEQLENARAQMMSEEDMREYTEDVHEDPETEGQPLSPPSPPPPPSDGKQSPAS